MVRPRGKTMVSALPWPQRPSPSPRQPLRRPGLTRRVKSESVAATSASNHEGGYPTNLTEPRSGGSPPGRRQGLSDASGLGRSLLNQASSVELAREVPGVLSRPDNRDAVAAQLTKDLPHRERVPRVQHDPEGRVAGSGPW